MRPEDLFSRIERPSRYLGTEINARRKDWGRADIRIAFVFPDLYEIGMSHLGLHILYHTVNELPWALADRAYCPHIDLEKLMRSEKVSLWGLESRRPLIDFDVLAITLPYELCYVNILTILDLAGIPFRAEERMDSKWPIIIGGGTCSINPEPVAEIFDAILVGDGEEALPEIAGIIKDRPRAEGHKDDILSALSRIHGVYVPGFYMPRYEKDGSFAALEPGRPGLSVERRLISDLDRAPFPIRPLVPHMQIVHDRLGIEIARGCTRNCRFCQAGMTYRPVRERSPQQVLSLVEDALRATGFDELSLLSLSTGDYECLMPLLNTLMDRYMPEHIAISLPSLRVGTLNPEIMKQIKRVRKTGFTLAPEAGSERLRQVINKGITEHDLIETAAQVYELGWSNIKLYFMIGLPTETRDDVVEIAGLSKRVLAAGIKSKRGRKVTVSVGTFIPKAHTPFQWERQLTLNEARDRLDLLRSCLKGRAMHFKWHDPRQSFLEGVFARGDRRLAKVLFTAWKMGARLDAWGDHMRPELYEKAALQEGVDLDGYLEAIDTNAPLPWDHILTGVSREYLLMERENARQGISTPDCRHGDCQNCEVCDFKHIRPVVYEKEKVHISSLTKSLNHQITKSPNHQISYHLIFSKLSEARFLGHLEVMHIFHRAAKRAGIPIGYTQGFHPMPRFSFGQPIPLGTESLAEPFAVSLRGHARPDRLMDLLNREMPIGITIESAALVGPKTPLKSPSLVRYLIYVPGITGPPVKDAIERLDSVLTWPVNRIRKGKEITTDLKQVVDSISRVARRDIEDCHTILRQWPERAGDEQGVLLDLTLRSIARYNLKPTEVVNALLGLSEKEVKELRIIKLPPASKSNF